MARDIILVTVPLKLIKEMTRILWNHFLGCLFVLRADWHVGVGGDRALTRKWFSSASAHFIFISLADAVRWVRAFNKAAIDPCLLGIGTQKLC